MPEEKVYLESIESIWVQRDTGGYSPEIRIVDQHGNILVHDYEINNWMHGVELCKEFYDGMWEIRK